MVFNANSQETFDNIKDTAINTDAIATSSASIAAAINYGTFAVATKIAAGDMSLASLTFTTYLAGLRAFSLQVSYTGAPVGTLDLSGSNDNSTFIVLNGTSTSITAAGATLYNMVDQNYLYYKLTYTKQSGTGTLTAIECIKST